MTKPLVLRALKRDFDAIRLNAVVNDPDVRPFVLAPGTDTLDLTPLVLNLANIALMCDSGGLVFVRAADGMYEVHTQFLASARGAQAVAFTQEAVRWVFTRTDAFELWTKVPESNRAALGLVRAMHGRLEFVRKETFLGAQNVAHFVLRYPEWAQTDPQNRITGEWFHDKLARKLGQASCGIDPALANSTGATLATLRTGQLDKAILWYNRFAVFAGYTPISLLARWPVTLELDGNVIAFSDDAKGFEIVRKGSV